MGADHPIRPTVLVAAIAEDERRVWDSYMKTPPLNGKAGPQMSALGPGARRPLLLVASVGDAEGSRGAAAALACASAAPAEAALLVDLGASPPRPTLLASAAAKSLAGRLAANAPAASVAARGRVCHLAAPADRGGLEAAAAVFLAEPINVVLHLPASLLPLALEEGIVQPTGVLLRADLHRDRLLTGEVVRELLRYGFAVSVLKRRLGWAAERRALFGDLSDHALDGLPASVLARLLPASEG